MKSTLNELIGSVDSASHTRFQPTTLDPTRVQQRTTRHREPMVQNIPQVANCSRMFPWQTDIVNLLRTTDVYVPASPGGGKTLPYMCHWSQNILGINTITSDKHFSELFDLFYLLITNPSKLDKLLIMVPIRQLADQTTQEFYEFFGSMLGEFLRLMINEIINLQDNDRNERLNQIYNSIDSGFNSLIIGRNEAIRRIESNRYSPEQIRHDEAQIKQADIGLQHMIEAWIKKLTILKQSKLVAERTGANKVGDPKEAPVIISIYQSAPAIISSFSKQLKLVVCDESHKIQQSNLDDSSSSKDISDALYTVLRKLDKNTRLCFLSGTINPTSANMLANYLNSCFKRNMVKINVPSSAKNASNITVTIDESIKEDRELIRIIKNKNSSNNLIVLFSKKGIDRIADAVLASSPRQTSTMIDKTSSGRYRPKEMVPGGLGNVSRKPNINYKKTGLGAVSGDMTIAQIYDSRLRACAYAGFGYLYRLEGTTAEVQKRSKDNMIIAQLFKEKKIRTLLATDAVGVGVNIDVRVLYIPKLEKFTGGKFQLTSTAELAQLLHRTGRGAFKFSRIVTTEKAYPTVVNAVSAETNKFTEVDVIEKFPVSLCHAKDMFQTVYKGYNQRGR